MKPEGAGAVMADRARGEVAGDDARAALFRQLEYFPTPPWAARAGGELINAIDPPADGQLWMAWEPACGEGHMAHGLKDYFQPVHATDIHGHDGDLRHGPPLDFLSVAADGIDGADWIITNPPFGLAAEFVAAGLRRARRGVAILARTSFLESATRFAMFFEEPKRLHAFAPFAERVAMTLGAWDPKASTATSYAWFVWVQPDVAAAAARGPRPEIWPIAPGTKARLSRTRDAVRFGRRGEAPLFDDLNQREGSDAR